MRFMLLQHYAPAENCGVPMHEWRPEDIQAHIAFQQALNAELLASGELVDAQGLSDQAKTVTSTGTAPVITTARSRSRRSCLRATGLSTSSRSSGR